MADGAVAQLGYLAFQVGDLAAWEQFATGVLGLTVAARRGDGALAFRHDSRAARFFVEPGPLDDLTVVGWIVPDDAALTAFAAKLRATGVEVIDGTPDEAAARRVARLVKLRDPAGIPLEVACGQELADTPFHSDVVPAGFVADDLGLGHLVITAIDPKESQAFYESLFGLRFSDRVVANVHGYKADIGFFHVPGAAARHHSLAFGNPQQKRIAHFMVEARAFDDVGLGFDRTLRAGLRIMHTLGRHPNDRMFSFYARTPSGFQFELGWGGRLVDDANWQPATYDRISEWGHHPPQFLVPPPKGNKQ